MRRVAERNRRAVGLLAAGAAILAAPVQAAPAPPAPTVSEVVVTALREVSEVTVTAKLKCLSPDKSPSRLDRPKVVSSYPAKGAVVRPGLLVVRVTFDQPMACDGLLMGDAGRIDPCPGRPQQLVLSYDRRTVRTVCLVEPGVQYGLQLSPDPNGASFIGLGGLPSQPYRLDFATSTDAKVTTVCEALSEDAETARQIRQRRPLDCAASPSGG